MGSAHRLTYRNIRVKFNINLSKGSGDMVRIQNSSVNHMTLKRDLDLESAVLHTVSLKETYGRSSMKCMGGMKELCIFLEGITKLDYLEGVISRHKMAFS